MHKPELCSCSIELLVLKSSWNLIFRLAQPTYVYSWKASHLLRDGKIHGYFVRTKSPRPEQRGIICELSDSSKRMSGSLVSHQCIWLASDRYAATYEIATNLRCTCKGWWQVGSCQCRCQHYEGKDDFEADVLVTINEQPLVSPHTNTHTHTQWKECETIILQL